jgi:hypothetical protein
MAATISTRMMQSLTNAAGNSDGFYAQNIGNGGGTAGALLRRELIERRNGVQGDGYYLTRAGFEAAGVEPYQPEQHTPIAPPADSSDVHAVGHLAAGSALVRHLPADMRKAGPTEPQFEIGEAVRTSDGADRVVAGYDQQDRLVMEDGSSWTVGNTLSRGVPVIAMDVRPGDTLQYRDTGVGRLHQITVDRNPWTVNRRTTALSDGESMFDALTDSLVRLNSAEQEEPAPATPQRPEIGYNISVVKLADRLDVPSAAVELAVDLLVRLHGWSAVVVDDSPIKSRIIARVWAEHIAQGHRAGEERRIRENDQWNAQVRANNLG